MAGLDDVIAWPARFIAVALVARAVLLAGGTYDARGDAIDLNFTRNMTATAEARGERPYNCCRNNIPVAYRKTGIAASPTSPTGGKDRDKSWPLPDKDPTFGSRLAAPVLAYSRRSR